KKLKLKNDKPSGNQRYPFTTNDELFIGKYKSNKLSKLQMRLEEAVVNYSIEKINYKMNSKWYINSEADSKAFDYLKQELVDDEIVEIFDIIEEVLVDVHDQTIDILTREILMLFR